MTIIKHRDIRGLVGTLCGACIVTFVALGFGAAPALASDFISIPVPPQVKFISNGQYDGTLQIQGNTVPITGTIEYLTTATTHNLKILIDPEGQQPHQSWVVQNSTAIDEWEIVNPTDPKTCRMKVLSGDSYPQCTAWS
jgi:hypothetical protein